MTEYYRAREAFAISDENGCPRPITPGMLVSSDDPAYKGRESMFEPVGETVARYTAARTETATAGPGELRASLTGPKKASSAKPKPGAPAPAPSQQPEATTPDDEPKGD